MFLGCFNIEGETSALMGVLQEPIKGKRGIPAAIKRLKRDYTLMGCAMSDHDYQVMTTAIEEQFS